MIFYKIEVSNEILNIRLIKLKRKKSNSIWPSTKCLASLHTAVKKRVFPEMHTQAQSH